MSRRATLRLLLLGLLLCWCGVFLRSENTEKSIVRALLLEQTPEQWNVALLYQFPEAAADSSDAAASVQLCAGTGETLEQAVDSSYNMTTYGDSLYKCKPMNTIQGFAIALTSMHIGDSCTVIIPYFVGYDTSTTSNIKKPYSTLIYEMKLVDIPA